MVGVPLRAIAIPERFKMAELKKRIRKPTWPVGADLLFERVRSVEYMVLATSLTLMIWLYQLLLASRSDLGNTHWNWHFNFYLKPLYWVAYADCPNNDNVNDEVTTATAMNSGFGQKSCNSTIQAGFFWEILWASLQNLFDMVLLQMVNNPWRTKVWGVPALAVIVFNIVDFGKLVFSDDLGDANADNQLDVLITAQRILNGMFASCWIILLYLLARVLWDADFNGRRATDSLEYTRRLLFKRASVDTAGAPARFQQYAEAIKTVCDQEDVPFCAQAALRQKELREKFRREGPPQPPPGPIEKLRAFCAAMSATCRRSAEKEKAKESVAKTAAEEQDNTKKSAASTASARSGLKSLDRLPSLAQVSLLLSLLMVIFAGVYIIYFATLSKVITVASATVARDTATSVEQASEVIVLTAQALQGSSQELVQNLEQPAMLLTALNQQLLDSFTGLSTAVGSLDQLATQLETAGRPTEANTLRQVLANVNALPVLDSDQVTAAIGAIGGIGGAVGFLTSLNEQLAGLVLSAQAISDQVKKLNEYVRFGANWVEKLGTSSEKTMVASACVGLPVAFFIIFWTRRSWLQIKDQVKVGGQRKSPYWEPELFDPVKAPTLPGLMASSVLLAFISVVLLCFVVSEGLVMAIHSGFKIPWNSLGSMALGSGTMIVVKVLVLDKLARHFLTHNGFVTAWVGFAWFVCFTLPFYALTSILAAIFRFVVLVGVGFGYVAAVHTTLLPPFLQSFDPGYTASMAMMLMAHRHNSPINFTFSQAFLGDGVGHELSKRRAQKNWKMAVTMVRNPQLADLRVFPEDEGSESSESARQMPDGAGQSAGGAKRWLDQPNDANATEPQPDESAGLAGAREVRL